MFRNGIRGYPVTSVCVCVRACVSACVRSKTYENAVVPSLMIQEFRRNVISGTVLDVSYVCVVTTPAMAK